MSKTARKPNRPPGWNHTDEAKAKISAKIQAAHAAVRDMGYPESKRCSKCKTYKNTIQDFTWEKRVLVSNEITYRPRSWCKACQAANTAAWKARKGQAQVNADERRYYRNRRKKLSKGRKLDKVDKGPFLEFYAAHKASVRSRFIHDLVDPDRSVRGRSTTVSNPNKARFDVGAFCAYMGITRAEYERIERMSRANTQIKSVDIELVDRVLITLGQHDQLAVLYPSI